MFTDTSDVGIRLERLSGKGRMSIWQLHSFLQHERNYLITEKELLSVKHACQKFHTYLLGSQVTVRLEAFIFFCNKIN